MDGQNTFSIHLHNEFTLPTFCAFLCTKIKRILHLVISRVTKFDAIIIRLTKFFLENSIFCKTYFAFFSTQSFSNLKLYFLPDLLWSQFQREFWKVSLADLALRPFNLIWCRIQFGRIYSRILGSCSFRNPAINLPRIATILLTQCKQPCKQSNPTKVVD